MADDSYMYDDTFSSESAGELDASFSSAGSDYTPDRECDTSRKMKYRVITEEKRKMLIELIGEKGLTIAKAARKVGVKYSTAKTIYGVYQNEGRVKTKLRRGVGAEKKKKTPQAEKKTVAKKSKATTPKVIADVAGLENSNISTRPRRQIKKPLNNEPEKTVEPRVQESRVDIQEPQLKKVVKIDEKQSLPVTSVSNDYELLTKRVLETQYPTVDRSIEQQLLLTKLNYLMANGAFASRFPINTYQVPVVDNFTMMNLLKSQLPNTLPGSLNSPNFLPIRNCYTGPDNFGNALLISSNVAGFGRK